MAEGACYQEPYLPASFKGVPFVAVEVTSEHGRRGAEGEFPFGERTAYADLGRRIRTYTLRGRLQTNAHVLEAAALIAACESVGPGVLVHPTRGIVQAACRSLRVSDRVEEEMGVTYVDLDMVEANNWANGLSLVGTILGLALGAIIGASRTSFRERYNPAGSQVYYRDRVIAVAQNAVGEIRQEYDDATEQSTDLNVQRALADLREVEDDPDLAADPVIADRAISLGMNAIAQQLSGVDKYAVFRDLANWATSEIKVTGVSAETIDAVYSHMRILAAAYMAQAAVETRFSMMGDAFASIDAITSILESEAALAYARCDNPLFLAIRNFLTEAQALLYNKAYNLPSLVEYNFGSRVSPLVAAYSIYGDAKRHRELEASNLVSITGRIGPEVVASS